MENKDINKALIRFTKAGKVHAEEKVNVVYLPLAEKLIFWTAQKGTDKIWPNGSLTDADINNSPELQDIFVRLSKAERSEIVREVKFVWQNHDAIQDYVAENGWASIGYIRKQITKKDKPAKDTAKDSDTGDTGEDVGEDTTPTIKDVAYFADRLASLINEAKSEGISLKDIIGHTKAMSNVA
tara:strand:- start:204 stop:752 length:549 start_codon:yes stop_codon:yes gene_type:complete